MKLSLFATGITPDGYSGKTANVKFMFDGESGKTVVIWGNGAYFTYQTPQAIDKFEALWLLKNHPSSNASLINEVCY